jgi:pimeloyl-ACP methyl ester carboxylesterase
VPIELTHHKHWVRSGDHRLPVFVIRPQQPTDRTRAGTLIIYGGREGKEFSKEVIPFAEILAQAGITVFFFDFRDNIPGTNFHDFGIWHRIEDAEAVLRKILTWQKYDELAMSVVGVSMGGHIATHITRKHRPQQRYIDKLVLVAPAAYAPQAVCADITFGPKTRAALQRPEGWRESGALGDAEWIRAHSLIVEFGADVVVPKAITRAYYDRMSIHASPKPQKTLVTLPYHHSGTFGDPIKRSHVTRSVINFLLHP